MNGITREEYISTIPDPQSRQEVYMYNICVKLDALAEFMRSSKECRCLTETKESVRKSVENIEKEIEVESELKDIKTKTKVPRKKKSEQVV